MMQFPKANLASAIEYVSRYANIEVVENETNIFVISDSSVAINEFEAQLAAASVQWDDEDCNGRILLETIVNIQGVRTNFRPRYNDEWQARYEITTR
jgi:hypothetical protein